MAESLVVSRVKKRFGQILAVDDISFSASPGDVLGFLGPNGAGKSTTMKIITGYLQATAGEVTVLGDKVGAETRKQIGYLPENSPLYGEMTVRDFLAFIAGVRRIPVSRVDAVLETLALFDVRKQKIETLSKGYKRRVGLAQAIIHDPPVLILDEPTDGLDPNQKRDVRSVIRDMAASKTIIISTHILEEVGSVCNRALIISKGKIAVDSTPGALRQESKYAGSVVVRLSDEAGQKRLGELGGVKGSETRDNGEVILFADEPLQVMERVKSDFGSSIASLSISGGELDDVFYKYSNS